MEGHASHSGTIVGKTGHMWKVRITLGDACQHCSAQNGCLILSSRDRIIDVAEERHGPGFEIGEKVEVCIKTHSGLRAVLYAYVLPAVCLMSVVITLYLLHTEEGIIALSAITTLGVYFLMLYLFRHRIDSKFSFTLRKIPEQSEETL